MNSLLTQPQPMLMLIRSLALILALLVLPGVAHADVFSEAAACVGGWAASNLDPEQIKKDAEFLAKYGNCLPLAAESIPAYAPAVATLVILKDQYQKFDNVDGCVALKTEALSYIADQLDEQNIISVPDAVKEDPEAYLKWIEADPTMQSVAQHYTCACAFAVYGSDRIKQLAEVVEKCGGLVENMGKMVEAIVGGLGKAIEDIAKGLSDVYKDCLEERDVLECAESLGGLAEVGLGWIADGFNAVNCTFNPWADCDDDPPPPTPAEWYVICKTTLPQYEEHCKKYGDGFFAWCSFASSLKADCEANHYGDLGCLGVYCNSGTQCGGPQRDKCVSCSDVEYATTAAAGICGCQGDLKQDYLPSPSGPVLLTCTCPAPLSVLTDPLGSNNPHCGCPGGKIVIDNECRCPPDQITLADGQCYCPGGKVKVGQKCVTPCADPGQVLLQDGSCCAPSQVTSCGLCCPEGQKPNATGGSCVSASPTTHPPKVIPVTIAPQHPAATLRTAP